LKQKLFPKQLKSLFFIPPIKYASLLIFINLEHSNGNSDECRKSFSCFTWLDLKYLIIAFSFCFDSNTINPLSFSFLFSFVLTFILRPNMYFAFIIFGVIILLLIIIFLNFLLKLFIVVIINLLLLLNKLLSFFWSLIILIDEEFRKKLCELFSSSVFVFLLFWLNILLKKVLLLSLLFSSLFVFLFVKFDSSPLNSLIIFKNKQFLFWDFLSSCSYIFSKFFLFFLFFSFIYSSCSLSISRKFSFVSSSFTSLLWFKKFFISSLLFFSLCLLSSFSSCNLLFCKLLFFVYSSFSFSRLFLLMFSSFSFVLFL